MINSKITKSPPSTVSAEEKLFKLLESIDWKLWEMYNMMKKDNEQNTAPARKSSVKSKALED